MAGVRTEVMDGPAHPAWDDFVAVTPGGSHVQTSRWAAVKAATGWSARLVVARRGSEIVGGCQLLVRRTGPALLAYAPRGPLVARGEDEALAALIDRVVRAARGRRPSYLKVQPPVGRADMAGALLAHGFAASDLEAAPRATVLVDVTAEPEAMLARMRSGSRANVRKALRRGVTVRSGGEGDFAAFGALLEATGRRQAFDPYPVAYFRRMWEIFGRDGRSELVLAEHEGRLLSGLLVVGFGDTAAFKIGGWSGEQPQLRPNELAHWTAMRWAHERGYRWYDLEGFPPEVERALARGEDLPEARTGVAWFKLGLGGEVRVLPGAYDTSPVRWLRPAVRAAAPHLGSARGAALRLMGRR